MKSSGKRKTRPTNNSAKADADDGGGKLPRVVAKSQPVLPIQACIPSDVARLPSVSKSPVMEAVKLPFVGSMTPFNIATGLPTVLVPTIGDLVETPVRDSVSRLSSSSNNNNKNTEWLDEDLLERNIDRVHVRLDSYIRGPFFDKCKFISALTIKKWDYNPHALCLKICKDMNVKKEVYVEFWETHATRINTTLNQRRNNVQTLLKNEFMSKYTDWQLKHLCHF
jgi:hypothetical protein